MATDLDMHYGKKIDFISFPLCGLNLVIKLRNFGFGSNWRDFNIFWSKTDFRFEYFLSNSVWFGLSFIVWVELCSKLRNTDYKLYWDSFLISR